MNSLLKDVPGRWFAITIALLALTAAAIGGYLWLRAQEATTDGPTATPESLTTGANLAIAIGSAETVTFTVPAGWRVQDWAKEEIATAGQSLHQLEPRLRLSVEQFLSALQADSQILLLQPEVPTPESPSLILTSIPSHGLRLEQIASQFASETSLDRLMDTSLRSDGQPILRIRGEQLTGLDSRAIRPQEVAMFNNSRADELILILQVGSSEAVTNPSERSVLETILRSLQLNNQNQ